ALASIEFFWLLLIAAFAAVVSIPVFGIVADDYLKLNVLIAILFALYFRMVVFFRQIPYLKYMPIQILLFFLNIPLFIKVLGKMQVMFFQFDTFDLTSFLVPDHGLTPEAVLSKFHLYRNEFLLFSVGLLILIVLTEFRLILAFIERIKKIE